MRQDRAHDVRSTAGHTEAELLASTRRILAETDDISNRTLNTLNEQSEQLRRVQADSDAISSNLDQSEWLLRGLKPWGWVRNMFKEKPTQKRASAAATPAHFTPAPRAGSDAALQASLPAGGKAAERLIADEARRGSRASAGTRPDKASDTDRAYEEIGNMLEGLKHKSSVINKTLAEHNRIIPNISEGITRDHDRIQKQNKDMKDRLKR